MLDSAFSGSAAGASENVQSRDIRHALAASVALIEMVAIGTSTYTAFIAYHLIVWGAARYHLLRVDLHGAGVDVRRHLPGRQAV
jgi:hypothetical protein